MENDVAGSGLAAGLSSEDAFAILIERCCLELDHRLLDFLETDMVDAARKCRVSLRRLTVTLDAFAPMLKRKETARQRARAKAIFRTIGAVRDEDVYVALRGGALSPKAHSRAQKARQTARTKLRKSMAVRFAPQLRRLVSERGLYRRKGDGPAALAQPVEVTAALALEQAWDACQTVAAEVAALSDSERHDLRKRLKRFRYLGEFFAPIVGLPDWESRRAGLRSLQDALGDLNDQAVARGRDGRADALAEAEALMRAQDAWSALRAAPTRC